MNILHILDTCNRGGAETLVLDILRNASASGENVCFASFKGGVLLKEYQKVCPNTYLLGREKPIDFRSIVALHDLIVREKIDVIHTHLTIDVMYAQLAKVATKAKHIHTHHGYDIGMPLKDSLVEHFFSPFLDAQIFVSQPLYDYYCSKYRIRKNWKIIENGVDVRKITSVPTAAFTLREELNIASTVPLIGMIGNFVNTGRDQLTVCKALKVIHDDGVDFQFLFVGRKSSQFPEIYDQCVHFCDANSLSQNVHFLGAREDVPRILSELNLFVYASNHDTFGIAVIEAMLAAVPVFVNDLEIFDIIGENGKYLSVYPTKDYRNLADMIVSFLHDAQSFVQKSRCAKRYAAEKYSIDRNISDLLKVYREISNG